MLYNLQDLNTKLCYNLFVGKHLIKPYIEIMWQNQINIDLQTADWNNIYMCNSKLTPKKLSEFKYKILLNFLSCEDRHSQWNTSISKQCDLCGETESIIHLLYMCP